MSLRIVRNDITKMNTEAIVNTANEMPVASNGCDIAVYRAAGYEELLSFRKEKIGRVPEGEVFISPGYKLKARYIIHAVSPRYRGGSDNEEKKLRSCYRKSLALADEYHIKSIAFPLISTGSYGYPREEGMRIAIDEINAFLLKKEMEIYLVVFGERETALGNKLFDGLEEYIDRNYVEEKSREEYGKSFPGDSGNRANRDAPSSNDRNSSSDKRYFSPYTGLSLADISSSTLKNRDEIGRFSERKVEISRPSLSWGKKEKKKTPHHDEKADYPDDEDDHELSLGSRPRQDNHEIPLCSRPRQDKAYEYEDEREENYEGDLYEEDLYEAASLDFESEHEGRLEERIQHLSDTYSEYLLYLIQKKHMENADVYKRAIVNKKIFSKIKNNKYYHPQKLTALCLCVGARLNLDETKDLLARAGYALSPCDKTDIIFAYFIENKI